MRRISFLRVLCFTVIYFSAQLVYAAFFAIRQYSRVQPAEMTWYLQHPLEAFGAIFSDIIYSPRLLLLLGISFGGMVTWALLLGFITELGFTFFKEHIPHKKLQAE